jgi:hypothetical protein
MIRRPLVVRALVSAALLMMAAPVAPAGADPSIDYMLHCRGCHGPDGAGAPGAAPSFRGHLGKFLLVPGGREYLIRVPGTAQSELDDAHTAALLNWLLQEFSRAEIPTDFIPYETAEVGRNRHDPLVDVWETRRQLLLAIDAAAPPAAAAPAR